MSKAVTAPTEAILVELDYKASYSRFALTQEEFQTRFPETYYIFGPIVESNSDTLKPLVHIWFEPCCVGDDKWTTFFADMADGLPESDIKAGNLAYIDIEKFGKLRKYIEVYNEQ